MAYDGSLAARVRKALAPQTDVGECKMFGGLAFPMGGNMCCGMAGDTPVLQPGDEAAAVAPKEPHTQPMNFTGGPIASTVYAGPGRSLRAPI